VAIRKRSKLVGVMDEVYNFSMPNFTMRVLQFQFS
jgi:hypothetical protein